MIGRQHRADHGRSRRPSILPPDPIAPPAAAGTVELRPGSYLVTPTINAARKIVLDELNVDHIAMSTEEFAKSLKPGSSKVALRDGEGVMLAVLNVQDVWQPDRSAEAKSVFGSTSKAHPGADYTMNKSNPSLFWKDSKYDAIVGVAISTSMPSSDQIENRLVSRDLKRSWKSG